MSLCVLGVLGAFGVVGALSVLDALSVLAMQYILKCTNYNTFTM